MFNVEEVLTGGSTDMAEQSPIGRPQGNDPLQQRKQVRTRPKQPSGPRRAIKRITSEDAAPPARGLIRKEKPQAEKAPAGDPSARKVKRRVPVSRTSPTRITKPAEGQAENGKPKVKIVTKTLPDGRVVKKRLVKKVVKKKKELTPEEEEQLRLEEERKAKEEAERKAEEERIRKEKEAEEERLRLEREAEEKRLEEERIRLEKEAEQKRIEEEKERQEKERQRILTKIEYYRGALGPKDKERAQQIAEEMVKRNIKWNGYISLTGGIGGAVQQ